MGTISAVKLLRSTHQQDKSYHKKGLKVMMSIGVIMAALTILAGDFSAKFLHENQPEKPALRMAL